MEIKFAAAYIRVSSDDQTEYSPDSQLRLIRESASRDGYVIPDSLVYQDDGISGKLAEKRPAFRLMIATAKEPHPPFEAIFVWNFSRFARNQEESIVYKNLLKKRGITVRSITQPANDSPFSSLVERIIEWMDEYYLINLSTEVRRGMTEKATRGEAMGTAPIGYHVENKVFVPDESAEIVRHIFSEFLSGKGERRIAYELAQKGIRTRRGNAPDNRFVHYILTNPVYIGKIRWSTQGHANYSRANYNGENVILVDGKHPPIIDMETWDAVQKKLAGRSTEIRYRRKDKLVYMLKGLLRCGSCGATLTMLGTQSPSLQCHRYAKGLCQTSHCITIAKANKLAISLLEDLALRRDFSFVATPPKKSQIKGEWDSLIQSEERKLKRATEAMLDGALELADYKAIKATIQDNLSKLRAEQDADKSQAEESATIDLDAYAKRVYKVLEIVKSDNISEEAKNEALRTIIEKIVYNKASNTFDFYFIT